LRVTRADLSGVAAEMVEGPLPSLRLRTDLVVTGGGTMVVDAMEWTSPGGPLGRLADLTVGRGIALRVLQARAQAITRRAGELATARVVVGAAIVRDGRLLAQQRDFPADAAGKWELPGGRVDPGETDADALVRECVEELGVTVRVGEQVGPDVPLKTDLLLRIFTGVLDGPGEPEAVEHRDLRWVSAEELDALDWLPADRALLPDLRRVVGP
jgi:8-oxo-dGTP diphosphatase